MKYLLHFFTFLLVLCFAGSTLTAQDRLPDKELSRPNGQKVSLATYGDNGKITVISFWATWCTPCKKELNNISDYYDDWQEDYNMELLAISIDDARNKAKVKSYADGQAWDYEVLLDLNGDLKRIMNFQTIPFTVIVDQQGTIVDKHSGYVEGDEFLLEDKLIKLSQK